VRQGIESEKMGETAILDKTGSGQILKNNRPLSKVNFYPIKSMGQIRVLKEV